MTGVARSRGCDAAACEDIGAGMRAQRHPEQVVRTLRPVLAWKGG